mgnify:CR=1 FL=1
MQYAPLSFDDNNGHGNQAHHDGTATIDPVAKPRAEDDYSPSDNSDWSPPPARPPVQAQPAKRVPPGLRKDLGWERAAGLPIEDWELEDPAIEEPGWGPGFLDKFKDTGMPRVVQQMNDAFLASRARCAKILEQRLLLKHNPREYLARMKRNKAASQKWAAGGGEGHDLDYCPGPKRKSVTRQAWYKMATSALAERRVARAP